MSDSEHDCPLEFLTDRTLDLEQQTSVLHTHVLVFIARVPLHQVRHRLVRLLRP